jgi:NAD(P)H-dependent FMN reductase
MERIGVIIASVREGRRGLGIAQWIHRLATPRAAAELIDLRDWPLPAYSAKTMPAQAEAGYAEGTLERRWADLVRGLDGLVIVTPEYNHGYPGQLKNALDTLYPAWGYKPVAFVTYGGMASGARASEQLLSVTLELRMVPIRDQVNLRLIGIQLDEHGAPTEELYAKRAAVMLDELVWFTRVMREARATRPA